MVKQVFLVISIISLCCFMYGILFKIFDVEENLCRMTFMFEYPQFVRIHFDDNKKFNRYGLYAYSEGYLTEKARSMIFTGAPVIFIPGNGGSFKQARSLASVAIRKGINNHWDQHLDYFSVDFNEEYSGIFGGYLENQKTFVQTCIKVILSLYKSMPNSPKQLVLIGHSMGAKIAQSLLTDIDSAKYINTIISIAGPMDHPVLNLDVYFEAFYKNVNDALVKSRSIHTSSNKNYCKKGSLAQRNESELNKTLDHTLFITIGGGSRDVLVHSGLTYSKYSDVHAMTTTIPNVWISTDHLCSVWCLQLVLVINRFLYSIIAPSKSRYNYKSAQYFIEDKSTKFSKAHHYFIESNSFNQNKIVKLVQHHNYPGDWIEESRRVYNKTYENGLNNSLIHMIRLVDSPQNKMLYAEVLNVDSDDWIFACAALEIRGDMRYCSEATTLQYFVNKVPAIKHKKRYVLIDLHRIRRANSSWTHLLIRLLPTKEMITLNVDIYDSADRKVSINMPKWYSYKENVALQDTIIGSSFYSLNIIGLHKSHQSLAVQIKTRSCSRPKYHVVAQVCVPWARGYKKYQHFTDIKNDVLYVYTPSSKPLNYNTTENPVLVNLHLDPHCRYYISYKNSFGSTMSRIDQQYFHWLPAHITAILLLSLKHQISVTPKKMNFKCGKLHSALINSSSFFIISATRIIAKFLFTLENFPKPNSFNQSFLISVIIHGSSLAIALIATAGLWLGITFYGNIAHTILLKLIRLPIPSISSLMIPVLEKIPITAGVILTSIAFGSCGGAAMICMCCIYFILITKQYEDYLEEFVHNTAKIIAKKLWGEFSMRFVAKYKNDNTERTDENQRGKEKENTSDLEDKNTEEETTETVTENTKTPEPIEDNSKEDNDEIKENSNIQTIASVDNETEEIENNYDQDNEELDRLLNEAIEKQKEIRKEKEKQEALERKEYDSVHKSISSINFHITLFLLLVIMTVLNIPSTISWAKSFKYAPVLLPDPSLIPAAIVVISVSILCQFSAPRNVYGYQFLSPILYVCAAICILYCQDSVYRLNGVISSVFLLITIHQLCAPQKSEEANEDENDSLQDKFEKMRNLISGNVDNSDG